MNDSDFDALALKVAAEMQLGMKTNIDPWTTQEYAKRLRAAWLAENEPLYVIFDGPPGPESGRFVEVENERGKSVSVGKWETHGDTDYWRLGPLYALPPSDPAMVQVPMEPTEQMLLAACRLAAPESEDYPSPALKNALRKSYIVMLSAAGRKA